MHVMLNKQENHTPFTSGKHSYCLFMDGGHNKLIIHFMGGLRSYSTTLIFHSKPPSPIPTKKKHQIVNQVVLSCDVPEGKHHSFDGYFHTMKHTTSSWHLEQKIQQQISARTQYCYPALRTNPQPDQ